MTIAESVAETLSTEVPPVTVLAAVSGGADSTALLICLHEYLNHRDATLVACHLNHGLRSAAEHAADLEAVRQSCGELGVALIVDELQPGAVRALASDEGSGIEAAARSLRYQFLARAARAISAGWVCTGHTEDDQVETVLMALERGVDPLALSGIPARRELEGDLILLRPMLSVRREQVETFLRKRGTSWSEDPTNAETAHERNRVRHKVLPELEAEIPDVRDAILSLRRSAEGRRLAAEAESQSLSWVLAADESSLDADTFYRSSREARLLSLYREAHRRGMQRPSSRVPVRFFAPLLGPAGAPGTIVRGRGSHIQREGDRLVWSADIVRSPEYGYLRSVTFGVTVSPPAGPALTVYSGEKETANDQWSVIELKQVRAPLVVRSHRVGDKIGTLNGSKSVASLLADQHVPRRQRCLIPVVCDRTGILAVLADGNGLGRNVVAHRSAPGGVTCTLVMFGVDRDG